MSVFHQIRELEVIPFHAQDSIFLIRDAIGVHHHVISALDAARLRVLGVYLHPVFGPALHDIWPAPVVESGLPSLVDPAGSAPKLIALGSQPLPVIREDMPGCLLDVLFAGLGVETSEHFGENVIALRPGFRQLARNIVQTLCLDELALVVHQHRTLYTVGTELIEFLVQGLTLAPRRYQDHVEVLAASTAEACAFFDDLVRVLPVEPVETHAFGQLADNPPVRLCVSRRIIEFVEHPHAALPIGAREGFLAPGRSRKNDVGIAGTDRVHQVDILIDDDRPAGIRARLQGVDDDTLVEAADLVWILDHQLLESRSQTLGSAHSLDPGGTNDMRKARVAGHEIPIAIDGASAPAGDLLGGLVARVLAAAEPAPLVASGARKHLPRPATAAADDAERRDCLGIARVVRPHKSLLDHDRRLGS